MSWLGTFKSSGSYQVIYIIEISYLFAYRSPRGERVVGSVLLCQVYVCLFVCLFILSFIEGNSTSVTSTAFQGGPHFTEDNIYIIIIQYFTIYMTVKPYTQYYK